MEILTDHEGESPKRVALETRLYLVARRLSMRHLEALVDKVEVISRLAAKGS
jgi:hypothetical protein